MCRLRPLITRLREAVRGKSFPRRVTAPDGTVRWQVAGGRSFATIDQASVHQRLLEDQPTDGLPWPERSNSRLGDLTIRGHLVEYDQSSELSQNTALGCHDRAAVDLQNAAASPDRKNRRQLKLSAAQWTLRGDMLERIAKSFRKRAALDEASKQYRLNSDRYER